jgi:hypothetical protein
MISCLKGGAGRRGFFIFCFATVLYAAVIGNLLEHGENMRFRVQTDPLLFLAAIYSIDCIHRTRAAGHSPS